MKNYPENLARISALQEAAEWMYGRADQQETEAESYRALIDEARRESGEEGVCSYTVECMERAEAMAKAFRNLADKLIGGVK